MWEPYLSLNGRGGLPLSRPALLEEGKPGRSDPHHAVSLDLLLHDKLAIVGFFPDRESGARGTPDIDHFSVAAVAFRQPLKKIEDQVFYDGVAHEIFPRSISV
jgi:hypothetical protein